MEGEVLDVYSFSLWLFLLLAWGASIRLNEAEFAPFCVPGRPTTFCNCCRSEASNGVRKQSSYDELP